MKNEHSPAPAFACVLGIFANRLDQSHMAELDAGDSGQLRDLIITVLPAHPYPFMRPHTHPHILLNIFTNVIVSLSADTKPLAHFIIPLL